MKKHSVWIVALLLFLLSLSASAVDGKLSASTVKGEVGEQVKVSVQFDNPGIVAMRIFVRYDSQILRLDSAENGEVFSAGQGMFGKDLTANPYVLLWDDSLNTVNNQKSGTLCTLTFTVKAGTPQGKTNVAVAVDKASTFDTNLNAVSVADATCIVGVPTVKTETTTAKKATTAKPSADSTTKPTEAPSTTVCVTTTRAVSVSTTRSVAKPSVQLTTSPKTVPPSVTNKQDETVKEPTTAAVSSASQTTARQETTVAPKEAVVSAETSVTESTQAEAVQSTEQVQRTQTPAQVEEKANGNRNLLWLLLLIPIAVGGVVIFRKKK